ncbi:hypothetical protein JW859_11105 [bacterium]|nr:hypothetical protein [bacterium]
MSGEENRETKRRRRWEYVRTQVDCNNIKTSDATVEQLGREGWELVSTVHTQGYVHFWFKREA